MFPAQKFPGWAFACTSQLTFDGAVEGASLDRAQVRRVTSSVTSDSVSGRVPAVAFMCYVKVHFNIPEFIPTPLIAVPTNIEALYVHDIYSYLSGVADDLSAPRFFPSIDWQAILRGVLP